MLERKPGAFDFARPLERWDLPVGFRLLRRRLEADLGSNGTREFIKVLRLMEHSSVGELTGAVDAALTIGATSADAVALILYHRSEQPVGLFSLDGHPHLKSVQVGLEPHPLRGLDRDRSMTMKPLETKSLVLLRHHLKALRLPTIGAEAEKVAAQAAADNQDHLSYLLQLCELELLEREERAAGRQAEGSPLPHDPKTLERASTSTAQLRRQQAARRRAGPLRVHRQARERPAGRQKRHRQVTSRPRRRQKRAPAALQGPLLPRDPSSSTLIKEAQDERGFLPPQSPARQARPARAG